MNPLPFPRWFRPLGGEPVPVERAAAPDPALFDLPSYPAGLVVGPCVCGSWPGGECLQCPVWCLLPGVDIDAIHRKR